MNDSKEQKHPQLLVGAAKADITPDFGTQENITGQTINIVKDIWHRRTA